MNKKSPPKKMPQELADAQSRLNSSVIRQFPEDEINKFRKEVDNLKEKYGFVGD